MLQSDLQAERFTGRKISKLWAKEMFAFFWQRNYYSFNDAKAGMGFHYDCGGKNEKFFDSRHRSATDMADLLWFHNWHAFVLPSWRRSNSFVELTSFGNNAMIMIKVWTKLLECLRTFRIQLFRERLSERCTRQSRKVLWVVLSSLFFKEIWKNDTIGHGRMFASAKGTQQK